MKRICIILSFVLFIFLSSCTSNGGATHTYGDWKYKINTKTKEVMLIGFSKEGKKKETIVLPTMIEGKKVTTIGYLKDYIIDDSPNGRWTADFSGATYNRIYFHSLIVKSNVRNGEGIYSSSSKNFLIFYGRFFTGTDLLYTNESYFQYCYIADINKEKMEDEFYNYNLANVVYYMNDDTDSTFFCDDCDGTKVNVIPPDPYRDGYKFIGWYKEKEGINEFDFENYIIPSKEYDGENVYILNETSIYAKWEKNKNEII